MRVHVGFAGGVTRCFALKPIGLVMSCADRSAEVAVLD